MISIRFNFVTKISNIRNLITFRVDKKFYFQFFQFRMSFDSIIIEQFRIHRQRKNKSSDINENDENKNKKNMRRRISYIKKQKLKIINYVIITWKIQKNDTFQFINKRAAAKNLNIIFVMFRHWLKNSSEIEQFTKKFEKSKLSRPMQRKVKTWNV